MNCYNMVLEYINKNEKGIPIFIEEIKEYIIKFYNEKDKEKDLCRLSDPESTDRSGSCFYHCNAWLPDRIHSGQRYTASDTVTVFLTL